jgi:ribosomal protein L9
VTVPSVAIEADDSIKETGSYTVSVRVGESVVEVPVTVEAAAEA